MLIEKPEDHGFVRLSDAVPVIALSIAFGRLPDGQNFSQDDVKALAQYLARLRDWQAADRARRLPSPATPVSSIRRPLRSAGITLPGKQKDIPVPERPVPSDRERRATNLLAISGKTTPDKEIITTISRLCGSPPVVDIFLFDPYTAEIAPIPSEYAFADRWNIISKGGKANPLRIAIMAESLFAEIVANRKWPTGTGSEQWWSQQTKFPQITWGKSSDVSGPPETPAPQIGAPQKYDWEAMQIELMRLVYLGKIKPNDRYAAVARMMADWFLHTTGAEPTVKSITDHVRPAMVKLREADEQDG